MTVIIFCQKFSSPASSSASSPMPKYREDSSDIAPDSKSQGIFNSGRTDPESKRCGKNHKGECMSSSDASFRSGKSGRRNRECPAAGQKGKYLCQGLGPIPLQLQQDFCGVFQEPEALENHYYYLIWYRNKLEERQTSRRLTGLIMAPKGKNPKSTKKETKESVPRRLFDEGSNCKEEEPLLRKQKKKKSPKKISPPPPIEVEESEESDTKPTTSEHTASEQTTSEQQESEYAESKEHD
ncbi:uncharacterized protein LOC124896772 [Capsicum annuum]|uniref:uncharacterized protein LOC124896772 n=1 Tax=Capsicum annuum TaxID=4072 RepID=UPI001FB0C7E7|nr:uncharacterized protein LOC124896772 [Capsicum annuum]